jgi:hypothetical protein
MKKLLIALFTLSVCFFKVVQGQELTDEEIINTYAQIGKEHNSGLDFILEQLKKPYGPIFTDGKTESNRLKMIELINSAAKNFTGKELSVTDIDLNNFIHPEIDIRDILGKDIVSALETFEEGKSLSPELLTAMKSLNELMDNDDKADKKDEYDKIIYENIGRLSLFKEKVYLVSCVNIGFSSLNYWNEKASVWEEFCGYKAQAKIKTAFSNIMPVAAAGLVNISWHFLKENPAKTIAKADVTGVIVGGVSGCITGAVGGTVVLPGVGTVAGCAGVGAVGAITGGLTGSATAAVHKFIDWIFGN